MKGKFYFNFSVVRLWKLPQLLSSLPVSSFYTTCYSCQKCSFVQIISRSWWNTVNHYYHFCLLHNWGTSEGTCNNIIMMEKMLSCSQFPKWIIISAPFNTDIKRLPLFPEVDLLVSELPFRRVFSQFPGRQQTSLPCNNRLDLVWLARCWIIQIFFPLLKCCIYTTKRKHKQHFEACSTKLAN